MAFDLNKYAQGNFTGLPTNAASLRAIAQQIVQNQNIFSIAGSSTAPVTWAQTALQQLDYYDKTKDDPGLKNGGSYAAGTAATALANATRWLTGAAQPTIATSYKSNVTRNTAAISSKLATMASNIANLQDIPTTASATEKAALQAKAAGYQKEMDSLVSAATPLGLDVAKITGLTKTDSGYIPTGQVTKPVVPALPTATTTPSATTPSITSNATDNTTTNPTNVPAGATLISGPSGLQGLTESQIYRDPSGKIYKLAAPAAPGVNTPGGITGKTSAILDKAGINYTGLTDTEIQQAEAAYTKAHGDTTLQNKVFAMQDITPEDVQGFLKTAAAEQDPYYKQLFSRSSEDFTRSLQAQVDARAAQTAQEKVDAAAAQDTNAVNAANAGLATSGIRNKAAARLAAASSEIAASSRRTFNQNITDTGLKAEDTLGSSVVSGLKLPTLNGMAVYNPEGNIRGSYERDQATNLQKRADELQADEQKRRQEVLAAQGGVSTVA